MKIAGSHTVALPRDRAYELLQDPEVLSKCIPGCDELKLTAPDEYEMKMKMAISSVQGLFTGHVRIADRNPPESFRLIVDGKGKVGFLKGEGVLTLAPADEAPDEANGEATGEATGVHYEGDVNVGGAIAGVGQRLIDTTAKFVIKKFFKNLESAATEAQP